MAVNGLAAVTDVAIGLSRTTLDNQLFPWSAAAAGSAVAGGVVDPGQLADRGPLRAPVAAAVGDQAAEGRVLALISGQGSELDLGAAVADDHVAVVLAGDDLHAVFVEKAPAAAAAALKPTAGGAASALEKDVGRKPGAWPQPELFGLLERVDRVPRRARDVAGRRAVQVLVDRNQSVGTRHDHGSLQLVTGSPSAS
jgi:hypothetical protein